MKNCKIYTFLYEKRKSGDKSFYTANEIARAVGLGSNGSLFRKMNRLAVFYDVLEVKVDLKRVCRTYRIKAEELK